ncbi:hypothetical protein GTY65_34560 [Streptomyces sp. SID8379]|uniref:hypothetical protein n=1 Tax=unclassified Streptomyces TaxID=2593676 RepID=UPI000370F08D|nr:MULTISPECIES: hypothetical protein [unclassified Streptomyces]MYW69158.1 hypothetical protein [Streptomyces sp. SID8379]
MYGPGAAPPSRNEGTAITLRVLFAVLSVLSCGLLSCVPLFRVAMLRGKVIDWIVAWAALPLSLTLLAIVGALPEEDPRTDVALAMVLIIAAGSAAHYVIFDIRRLRALPPSPMGMYPPTAPTVGYGYPHPQQPQPQPQPYAQPPLHHTMPSQAPVPPPQQPQPQQPPQPQPQQQNQGQPPHRIDQVRAELDELSDYLRKQDGGQ